MKTLLLALVALTPALASAEPNFWCDSPNSDLSVTFATPPTSAALSKTTNGSSIVIVNLNCKYAEGANGLSKGDYLTCEQANSEFSLGLNNSTGQIQANIYQRGRSKTVLTCGRH